MKYVCTFILALAFAGCNQSSEPQSEGIPAHVEVADSLPFPQWLVGQWHRLNDAEGENTSEIWEAPNNGKMSGSGYTLRGQDTVFFESLSLSYINGAFHYIVEGVNAEPTHFVCTSYTDSSMRFNNELNEFPKNITYSFKNDTITAIIDDGAGGNSVTFLLAK